MFLLIWKRRRRRRRSGTTRRREPLIDPVLGFFFLFKTKIQQSKKLTQRVPPLEREQRWSRERETTGSKEQIIFVLTGASERERGRVVVTEAPIG